MSSYFNFFKYQYILNNLTEDRLKTAVIKEYITSDEYKQITGENYTE